MRERMRVAEHGGGRAGHSSWRALMHLTILIIILIIITLVIFVSNMLIWNSFPDMIPFLITICLKNVKTGAEEEEKTVCPVICRKCCRKWEKWIKLRRKQKTHR